MSVRSGVFIKYVVKFTTPALTVSNDVLAGDVCIDGDVTVKMGRWTAGTTFTITFYDLPESYAKALVDSDKPRVVMQLGYFDTKVVQVVEGICDHVESKAQGDQLVTTIEGRETALFGCATTAYTASPLGDVTFAQALNQVLSDPKLSSFVKSTAVTNDLPSDVMHNPTFTSKKVLAVIDEVAQRVWPHAESMIVDGQVFLGSPIRYDPGPPAQFSNGVNLAKFDPLKLKIPASTKSNVPTPDTNKTVRGFQFTAVGDPTLRPGQTVIVNGIKEFSSSANPEFRIREVEHRFSATAGYVCAGAATERQPNGAGGRQIDTAISRSAASAAREIADKIKSQAADSPGIEVGSVKAATDLYTADLYYGQTALPSETQPSVNVAVDQQNDHVYASKPVASVFAWRKCGLVTPVYPGMKAVVLHNRALANDGIVAGYVWSKQPEFTPPPNKSGDWWLSLPIDFDATQPPQDSTNAVNDLTANDGCRVVELKGFKITVGASGLKPVGTRPDPGAAEVCTIAHASGAVITIKNGEIDMAMSADGSGPKLSMTSSGISMTDGTLNMQLANGKLTIG
jgi:hypothetical protein